MITYLDLLVILVMSGFVLAYRYVTRGELYQKLINTVSAIISASGIFYVVSYLSPVSLWDAILSIVTIALIFIFPTYLRNPHEALALTIHPLIEYIVLATITFFWLF